MQKDVQKTAEILRALESAEKETRIYNLDDRMISALSDFANPDVMKFLSDLLYTAGARITHTDYDHLSKKFFELANDLRCEYEHWRAL